MPSWDRKLCEHWENSDTHPGLWFIQITSPNNDGEVGEITFAQTLGAGSVEEQLAFEARYEFVTITKVMMMMMLVMMMITKIKISNKV